MGELHPGDNPIQVVDFMTDCHVCVAEPLLAVHSPWGRSVVYLDFIVQERVIPDYGEVLHNEIGVGNWHSCGRRGSRCNSWYSEYSERGRECRID